MMKTDQIETSAKNEVLHRSPRPWVVLPPGLRCAFQRTTYAPTASFATALTAILMAILSLTARCDAVSNNAFTFVNAVDNTQGFSSFGFMPAINDAGAVAFESTGPGFEMGSVWKWTNGRLTLIATSADGAFRNFGDNVVINAAGQVGFNTRVLDGNDTIIATGDGGI